MKLPKFWLPVVIVLFIATDAVLADTPASFQAAKKIARKIFSANPTTLYCGCNYNAAMKVDLLSCNMDAALQMKRANTIEWEHIVPAENIGRQRKCWQEKICERNHITYKGRKCCEQIDPIFKMEEGELYNLWPSVGLVNQIRSNYRYSTMESKNGFYGCGFEVDKTLRKVEPSDRAKGIVARATLFMSYKYEIDLSKAQQQLFEAWDKNFPPDDWEKAWAHEVEKIEGYSNPYIENHTG